jgi:hypothetical protein
LREIFLSRLGRKGDVYQLAAFPIRFIALDGAVAEAYIARAA